MSIITEWEFTADVASQINEILRDRVELPFSEAKCEERKKGSQKRRDLTIYDRDGNRVLTGEVKMPDKKDGRSPLNEAVVKDAHDKANAIGVGYFFTWNVNNCVLWKTFEQGKSITERHVEFFDALPAPVRVSDELLQPRIKEQVKRFLHRFLERCAAILSGDEPMLLLPLDEKFIKVWELALSPLVTKTLHAVSERYEKQKAFRAQLDRWMRDEQGWTLSNDEEAVRENLERAAKFSCYVLANKIVFYKALRRQFPKIKEMRLPSTIKTGEQLKAKLDDYFAHATKITRDYETVFQGDFGDTVPCLNDSAIDDWGDLLNDTDKFDFTQINYEVIGQIFERMLNPAERHKYGQHYTRSEVVDLINTFCIRTPEAKVLDPSCGGGTFLVRAYQRKSDLAAGRLSHQELVSQLFGTDISAYPVHLTTINLATRDLKEGANYPRVARQDFFKLKPNDAIFRIPANDDNEETDLAVMPHVDAIVGNPPYVRQEKINEYYGGAYKKALQEQARKDGGGIELSGRSDILCYFFTHGFPFLADGGMMGLLTSSNWLDTAYGFALQKFLLDNFEIVAIFESNCEPWFTGARVTTAATILRRQSDAAKRNANLVKFVWIKKPVADFLSYAHNEAERRQTFEDLRRRIETLTTEEETEAWRVRVVNQGQLYEKGCLPFVAEEEEEDGEAPAEAAHWRRGQAALPGQVEQMELGTGVAPQGEYTGYKWGIYLRAPEIFTKLTKRGGERLVPLGKIAEVRFGVKTGCDAFFFPRDITEEAVAQNLSEREFKERYGIRRADTDKIRIVNAGDGSQHLIEAKYLEPEVHSLMEVDSVEIDPNNLARQILLVPKDHVRDKHVLKYIKWGEQQEIHLRSTCASRTTWYDLGTSERGSMFWPMASQYRHVIAINSHNFICNHNLFDVIAAQGVDQDLLAAMLNSTIAALFKHQFGRLMGREGNLKTEVIDVKMMLVPDPRQATPAMRKRLSAALNSMRQRKALQLVEVDSTEPGWTGELALRDRQELDDAVLELLGISDAAERAALRDELYAEITQLYRQIRIAEKKMQQRRSATARAGKQTAHSIAAEIWEELSPKPFFQTPLAFVPPKAKTEEITLPAGRAKLVAGDMFQPDGVQIGGSFIETRHPARSRFVKELAALELTGKISIPLEPVHCEQALKDYELERIRLTGEFTDLAAGYTADETLQQRVVNELWKLLRK
ncbi:MAG: class I SAM-dependent DNA methyltransferase [Blastocatellales bacterium]